MPKKPKNPYGPPPTVDAGAPPKKLRKRKPGISSGNPDPPTEQIRPFMWKPGQSGNPAGRPRSTVEMKQRAAASTDDVMEILELRKRASLARLRSAVAVLEDPRSTLEQRAEADRLLSAADFDVADRLLDRGHGKPQQKVEIDTTSILDEMSEEEQDAYLIELTQKRIAQIEKRKAKK